MRRILFLFLSFVELTAFAQNATNHKVEPKGVYKEINLVNDTRIFQALLDTSSDHSLLMDSVERNPNKYIPPVLYALSSNLFVRKKYDDACYWFYLAQLRAIYDVNRSTDKTANADAYNQSIGLIINGYASQHLDRLKTIIPKVVAFERVNEEQYDPRWISLTGMDAMNASLGNQQSQKELSVDKSQWPAIKKKTIDSYYSSFKDALGLDNDDVSVDRSHMLGYDFRLFKGTPAWELAKAVQNQDTVKIKAEVNENKGLLSFVEPRFGQPLLSLAVMRSNYNSVKTLLDLGANPNMQSSYDGGSPVTEACKLGLGGFTHDGADPRFLELLLKHGGDPNIKGHSKKDSQFGDRSSLTPLEIACEEGNLDYVKILVNAGAKIDASTSQSLFDSAVVIARNPDVVMYLIEKGVNYKLPIMARFGGKKTYITDEMRNWSFDLDSELYKKKMQLAEFLKKNGMDYWKTPVPKGMIGAYPKDYLDKY